MIDPRVASAAKKHMSPHNTITTHEEIVAFPSYTKLRQAFARYRRRESVLVDLTLKRWRLRFGELSDDGQSIGLVAKEEIDIIRLYPHSLTIGNGVGDFVFVGYLYWRAGSGCERHVSGTTIYTVTKKKDVLTYEVQER